MEKLGTYIIPTSTNTVTFSGLDTAGKYNNFIVFYRLRTNSSAQSSFFVSGGHDGTRTWGGGTTVAWTTGSDVNYQNYSSTDGLQVHNSITGNQDIGQGFGIIFLSGRKPGERQNIMARHGMTGVLYNSVYGPSTGLSGATSSQANSLLVTTLRFYVPSVSFTIGEFDIYGN